MVDMNTNDLHISHLICRDITPANHVALGHHSSLSEVQNQLDSFLASSGKTVIFLQDKVCINNMIYTMIYKYDTYTAI